MKLRKLNIDEVRELYQTRLKEDFLPAELKTMEAIEQALAGGVYECLGMYDEEGLAGYVFLVVREGNCLIDYLAVMPEKRGQGFGGQMLRLLGDHLQDARSIIGEVEDPAFAPDEEERRTRIRRLNFYLRSGLIDTGVRTMTFGVPFLILEVMIRRAHTREEIITLYTDHYRFLLPAEMYEKSIHICE